MNGYEPHEDFAVWSRAYGGYGADTHDAGNLDCQACSYTNKCECGGVIHYVSVLLYPQWGDMGVVWMCDKCGIEGAG